MHLDELKITNNMDNVIMTTDELSEYQRVVRIKLREKFELFKEYNFPFIVIGGSDDIDLENTKNAISFVRTNTSIPIYAIFPNKYCITALSDGLFAGKVYNSKDELFRTTLDEKLTQFAEDYNVKTKKIEPWFANVLTRADLTP